MPASISPTLRTTLPMQAGSRPGKRRCVTNPTWSGKVIRSLRYNPGRAKEPRVRETIRRVLNYVVKNRSGMRYSELRA